MENEHDGAEKNEAKIKTLVDQIHRMAGEIGVLNGNNLEKAADAEDYEFQVETGLAVAAASILQDDIDKIITWLGYCMIDLGYEPNDRVAALMDALRRELYEQEEEDSE